MIDPVEICRERGWPLVTASDQKSLDTALPEALKQGDAIVWLKETYPGRFLLNIPAGFAIAAWAWKIIRFTTGIIPRTCRVPTWNVSAGSSSAAGVPFHFLGWDEWQNGSQHGVENHIVLSDGRHGKTPQEIGWSVAQRNAEQKWRRLNPTTMARVGSANSGRVLDGRTWEEMP